MKTSCLLGGLCLGKTKGAYAGSVTKTKKPTVGDRGQGWMKQPQSKPSTRTCLEQELQCQLNHPRTHVGLDLSERGRANLTIGQSQIGVIQDVEQLGPEL